MSSSVELPGPQPRSTTRRGRASGTCASRSRGGRVRSSSNLRYWRALQSSVMSTASLHRNPIVVSVFYSLLARLSLRNDCTRPQLLAPRLRCGFRQCGELAIKIFPIIVGETIDPGTASRVGPRLLQSVNDDRRLGLG